MVILEDETDLPVSEASQVTSRKGKRILIANGESEGSYERRRMP